MRSHNQRQIAVRLFLKRLGLAVLCIVAFLAASGVWGVYKKERETAMRRAEAKSELSDLVAREDKLRSDLETLGSDRGLEETLRAEFGLAERGESLIVIVDPLPSEANEATSTTPNWFWKIFHWW